MVQVKLLEDVAIDCSKVRRVYAEQGDDYIIVREGNDRSIGVYLEYDIDKVIAVVQIFKGPIEDDVLVSELAFYVDPEKCEVIE